MDCGAYRVLAAAYRVDAAGPASSGVEKIATILEAVARRIYADCDAAAKFEPLA